MTEIAINDLTPRNRYVAAGGETELDYDFPIFDADDITVQETDPDDLNNPVTLVRGTDYTVTGVNVATGGTIVFDVTAYPSGAVADNIYTIIRAVPYERLNDYQFSGDFESSDINSDLDRVVMMIQQLDLRLNATVQLDETDALATLPITIQATSARQGRVVVFNAAGTAIEAGPTTENVDIVAANISDINTIADAINGGNLSEGTAVSLNNTNFDVLTATNVQTAFEETDTALLNARSTGVRYGGNLSDQGSGVVRITAGAGQILDNTDPSAPDYMPITWSQTDIDLSATDDVYYIYVDNTGTVQSTTTEPSHADYRTDIYLWRVSIRSNVVSGTTSIVQPTQQDSAQIWDIWRALGFIKDGLALSAASTNLTIAIGAGEIYIPGVNFYNSALSPHEIEVSARSPVTFRHVDQDGDQTVDRTAIDVGNYDNAGTITAIPGSSSRATIFTVKEFPGSGNVRIFYGQEFFDNVDEAEQALQSGTYSPTFPASYDNAVTLGWIIAQKGATDLSDGTQKFITANKFGLTGGGISTSGANALLAVNNLSDVQDAATARANLGIGDSLQLLSTTTISNDATVDLTLPSTHTDFVILVKNLVSVTDDVTLKINTSSDGGSSFDTGASDYSWVWTVVVSGVSVYTDYADNKIDVIRATASQGVGNAAGDMAFAAIFIYNEDDASSQTIFKTQTNQKNAAGNPSVGQGTSFRLANAIVNAVRISLSTGNMASGEIQLWGLEK